MSDSENAIFIDHGSHHLHHYDTHDKNDEAMVGTTSQQARNTPHAPHDNPQDDPPTHTDMLPPLQTVVQLNIYREKDGRFEYLLLKRIDGDPKFWQVVTQPVHSGAALGDTLREAASTQVGIHGFKHLSHETYSYEWYTNGERGRDIVFAAEVSPETSVTPDRDRYDDIAWLPINEALQHLKWDGNRTALKKLDEHLIEKQAALQVATPGLNLQQASPAMTVSGIPLGSDIPTPYQQESYPVVQMPLAAPPASSGPGQQNAAGIGANGPYGPNVPRRLPDQPSAIAANSPREINPAELFL